MLMLVIGSTYCLEKKYKKQKQNKNQKNTKKKERKKETNKRKQLKNMYLSLERIQIPTYQVLNGYASDYINIYLYI